MGIHALGSVAVIAFVLSSSSCQEHGSQPTTTSVSQASPPASGITLQGAGAPNRSSSRPNILFIIADDMRPELGAYGSKVAKTPNMDALASSGALFENAFVSEAACAPSRASLLTGLRPDTTGITGIQLTDSVNNFAPTAITMPDTFRAAGYQTIRIGKVYNDPNDDPAGWTSYITSAPLEYTSANVFDVSSKRLTSRTESADYQNTLKAVTQIRSLSKSKTPFFFAVGLFRPHMPFYAPSEDWDRYTPATFTKPRNATGQTGAYSWSLTSDEIWAYKDLYPYRPVGVSPTYPGSLPADKAQLLTWAYLASVSSIDYNVGLLIKALKDNGLSDNTIVVLWGDHGWKLGDHNYWGKKSDVDDDIRIPLIVSAPGRITPGIRVKGIVETVDIFPTLAEMAGLTLPATAEGLSFARLFSNPTAQWKSAAFAQFPRYAVETSGKGDIMGYTVRTVSYSYTAWIQKSTGAIVGKELYDLAIDPEQSTNVAGNPNYASALATLEQTRINGWRPVRTQITG